MSNPRLILICGVIGAGKTTLAKQMEGEGKGIRLPLDEWVLASGFEINDPDARKDIEELQRKMARMLLGASYSVILENGFYRSDDRAIYLGLAQEALASCELHLLDVNLDRLKERIGQRNRSVPPGQQTHLEALESCFARFEMPNQDELGLFDAHQCH